MFWIGFFLILALIYIGFDYGRLLLKVRRQELQINEETQLLTRYIMIGTKDSSKIQELADLDVEAHAKHGINVKFCIAGANESSMKTYFENGDELLVYRYEDAEIEALTKQEKEKYVHRIFFDYKLPEGAERAVIEKLGLLDYMINVGICKN